MCGKAPWQLTRTRDKSFVVSEALDLVAVDDVRKSAVVSTNDEWRTPNAESLTQRQQDQRVLQRRQRRAVGEERFVPLRRDDRQTALDVDELQNRILADNHALQLGQRRTHPRGTCGAQKRDTAPARGCRRRGARTCTRARDASCDKVSGESREGTSRRIMLRALPEPDAMPFRRMPKEAVQS
jgi:hypothetical protein